MLNKKLLRFIPLTVAILVGCAIDLVRNYMDDILKDSFQIVIAAGLGLYSMIVLCGILLVWLLAFLLWRCRHCRRIISLSFSGNYCKNCGQKT